MTRTYLRALPLLVLLMVLILGAAALFGEGLLVEWDQGCRASWGAAHTFTITCPEGKSFRILEGGDGPPMEPLPTCSEWTVRYEPSARSTGQARLVVVDKEGGPCE